MMGYQSQFIHDFAAEANKSDPEPERLALYIAGIAYPDLDVDLYLDLLDQMAAHAAKELRMDKPGLQRATHFLTFFNKDLEFDGDRQDYYNAANSYLNCVMERRCGLPIMLSLLCMAIGRRLRAHGINLQIDGVGLPRHFMARYKDEDGAWLLDPFHGEVLTENDAASYLTRLLKYPVVLPTNALQPISATDLAYRILMNLRFTHLDAGNYPETRQILDYMLLLDPSTPGLFKERGLIHYHFEQWDRAARDLRRYFFLNGNLLFTMGMIDEQGDNMKAVHEELSREDRQLLQILEEVEETWIRSN
ncbi:transglutaminase-like domain-containing protein [Chloroflexi bacterium TSY]|nr:transglutaminase-like domain-containing protein [Chloroflexi bacterium TSY]